MGVEELGVGGDLLLLLLVHQGVACQLVLANHGMGLGGVEADQVLPDAELHHRPQQY
jgi:hypothetical protein